MVADLTQKYFDEGLSQAETSALEALLDSSPDDALHFSERALAEYKAMGLPEPRYRRRLAFARFRWPLALLFSAGLVWAFWPCAGPSRPGLGLEGESFTVNSAVVPEEEPERAPRHVSATGPLPAISSLENQPRLSEGRRLPAPEPSRQGSRLGVVVKQLEAGFAVISVRDHSGRELRNLFQGMLKPGAWRFEWDGRLDNGLAASPGAYSIAVRRGGSTQLQELTIRQQGQTH